MKLSSLFFYYNLITGIMATTGAQTVSDQMEGTRSILEFTDLTPASNSPTYTASNYPTTIVSDSPTSSSACLVGGTMTGEEATTACVGKNCCQGKGTQACRWSGKLEVCFAEGACNGYFACDLEYGITDSGESSFMNDGASFIVGANSCSGDGACINLKMPSSIGDESCQGTRACRSNGYVSYNIGDNSCNGQYACLLSSPITDGASFIVGTNSCSGGGACSYLKMPSSIGDESCRGLHACYSNRAVSYNIGDNSCIGYTACDSIFSDFAIYGASFVVGTNSCSDDRACKNMKMPSSIGNGSCRGKQTCESNGAVSYNIGGASCIGYAACYLLETGSVGDNSCLFDNACYNYQGDVGDNTSDFPNSSSACLVGGFMSGEEATTACADKDCCQGDRACDWSGKLEVCFAEGACNGNYACLLSSPITDGASFIVGANSCSGSAACVNLNMPSSIGDESCQGDGACESSSSDDYHPSYNIGDGSCIGQSACYHLFIVCYKMSTGFVGDSSCLFDRACYQYKGDVGDNQFQNEVSGCRGIRDTIKNIIPELRSLIFD